MNSKSLWMFLLILQYRIVTPRPTQNNGENNPFAHQQNDYDTHYIPKDNNNNEEQVISVRITSSVAVGRSGLKNDSKNIDDIQEGVQQNIFQTLSTTAFPIPRIAPHKEQALETERTDVPPYLAGANIEFIRQLNAKKEAKLYQNSDQVHPFQFQKYSNESKNLPKQVKIEEDSLHTDYTGNTKIPSSFLFENQDEDSVAEPSIKKLLGISGKSYDYEKNSVSQSSSRPETNKLDVSTVTSIVQSNTVYDELIFNKQNNDTDDSIAASSIESILTVEKKEQHDENFENIPLARSIPFSPSSKNYVQGLATKRPSERGNSASLTTVSFNILHETPNRPTDYNIPSNTYTHTDQGFRESKHFYETPKVYSQPAQIYSEPAKFYSEPAKIYSEPAKVYSEPAKVYSEPAKIYSEPAKFYSQPASLHLSPESLPNYTPWQNPSQQPDITSTILSTTPTAVYTLSTSVSTSVPNTQRAIEQRPEKNYEVDEKISVNTDGRSHGIQESSTEKCKEDNCKVGYVVEGRQYKKYRVEERTPDGFIVGEYGVVRNEDGALRGVRYTADSDASPRLIYDALMKFLQLK